jgi:hypothetical protein
MNMANISAAAAHQSLAGSSTQEATETLAQTKLEAAKGDPQAIQKLARLQAQQAGQDADKDGDKDSGGAESAPIDTSVVFTAKA